MLALAAIVSMSSLAWWHAARPGQVLAGAVASLQLAGAAMLWQRDRGAKFWPALCGCVALAACLAVPRAAPALGALARLAVYASLLRLFAGSLRAGQEPLVTRLARRIHPAMTEQRTAYTRGVTWLWTAFFGAQIALWLLLLAVAPFREEPWFAAWADLPMLAALLAGEMVVRAIMFRGQPHGSFGDMLRAARRA